MGQNRSDTGPQRAAKRRRSEDRRCPNCHRGNALRVARDSWDAPDATVYVTIKECRWRDRGLCDYKDVTEYRVPAGQLPAIVIPGTSMPCSWCGNPFLVTQDGVMSSHDEVQRNGSSTRTRCPGVGEPPRTA